MKLDLLKNEWLDIVFEGRNKSYGAYDLRNQTQKQLHVLLYLELLYLLSW